MATKKDAALAMAALGVGLLPVTENDRLMGIHTRSRHPIGRQSAWVRGPDGRVGDVMTAEVRYCYDDQAN